MMDTLVFAVKHKNKDVIYNSSSGGMFTALTDVFLNNNNAIASCIYDYKDDSVKFKVYTDSNCRNSARGSKYIQATIGKGFLDVENWLLQNPQKKLIAFGTGCQMHGLSKYLTLKKLRNRVILVDLICHGVTSPGLWNDYLNYKGVKGKLQYISFKDKRNGWYNPTSFIRVSGKEILINEYIDWFYDSISIRKSCYNCPYTKIDRETDITIGDFWGIEKNYPDFADEAGASLLLVHSQKGLDIFEKIKPEIDFIECTKDSCLQPRLISPTNIPKNREKFWNDVNNKGIEYCLKKYKSKEDSICFFRKIFRKAKKRFKEVLNHGR